MEQTVDVSDLESLPPEVIVSILLDFSVPQILSFCRVSKYLASFCRNWNFWAEKAKHDFGLPTHVFRQIDLLTPWERYHEIREYQKNLNQALYEAIKRGSLDLVKYLVSRGATNIDGSLYLAVLNDHLDLVKYFNFISQGAYSSYALSMALNGNHPEIIKYLISHGANSSLDLQGVVQIAASKGDLDLVQYATTIFPENPTLDIALGNAASMGHLDVVKYLLSQKNADINVALSVAASKGHLNLVQYLLSQKNADINVALRSAAGGGSFPAVYYLIDHGATDLNGALRSAALGGQLKMAQYLIDHGATDLQGALQSIQDPRYFHYPNIGDVGRYLRSQLQ
jgi:ankyrin repeat protein